jgi:hypothetical protein
LPQLLHRRQLPWGVVTNKSARFTEPLTRAMPLFATAGAVVSGDTTPHAKPHPEPLLEAARRWALRLSAACTWVTTSATSWRSGRRHGHGGRHLWLPGAGLIPAMGRPRVNRNSRLALLQLLEAA